MIRCTPRPENVELCGPWAAFRWWMYEEEVIQPGLNSSGVDLIIDLIQGIIGHQENGEKQWQVEEKALKNA